MNFEGAKSPELIRRLNASALLRFALDVDAFDASDAMRATGLTRSTVLGVCDDLVRLGWVDELEDARTAGQYSKGRPARRYQLRTRAGLVAGVDVGQHTVTALVADLNGRTLSRSTTTPTDDSREVRLQSVNSVLDDALEQAGADASDVLVTVIGVPAPVDENGSSPVGDGFWKRMNPGFVREFPHFGRIVVDNDANLAALAERARGAGRGLTSFAAMLASERLGAGLIINDTLIRGHYGGAGELRLLDLVDGVGSADGLAALARTWTVEALTDPGAAVASSLGSIPLRSISAADVFSAASAGDTLAVGIIDRLADRLARIAEVLVSLLDIERVIVCGAIAPAVGQLTAKAMTVLGEQFTPPLPEIVASDLGADCVLLGAIECGLQLVRANPLEFEARPTRTAQATEIY